MTPLLEPTLDANKTSSPSPSAYELPLEVQIIISGTFIWWLSGLFLTMSIGGIRRYVIRLLDRQIRMAGVRHPVAQASMQVYGFATLALAWPVLVCAHVCTDELRNGDGDDEDDGEELQDFSCGIRVGSQHGESEYVKHQWLIRAHGQTKAKSPYVV
ncbi:hypothetical protein PFICI_04835 [Pestalotiopsis fici W106-1]|uniref:Uncharacterized protein n=1 Tax=Pestalotiopsis fici (strain W106-1 / CGMCC3.15140) TaxID=1229662 RepID=W3XAA4_PESFW|nr:uncharacterized protein PFICI_04835 [Pestalotiopsis fici W106-1]ETS82959.1 hypothetical protein PFICI_04835 [Pestalotiopsis fici W106-1]